MSSRWCRGEAAQRVLHHVNAGAAMRRIHHQPHPAAGGQHGYQCAQSGCRIGQMVQHAAAVDVIEQSQAGAGQVQQRPLLPDDIGQFPSLCPALGDAQGGGGAIQPGHLARAVQAGHLLRQHDGGIAAAAAGNQGVQRLAGRPARAEHPVVDLPDVAGAADDQPFRFIARVAFWVGKGLILARQSLVCCVGHAAGIEQPHG